jgi:predicted metal-dependent enzyme (double-stranded beta helix superfamily)
MATISLPSADDSQLEALAALPLDLALREAVTSLVCLAENTAFLSTHVLPLLQEGRDSEDWYVAHSCNGQDDSYSLQVFVWPPGSRTQIHDHTSWGVYCCVVGSVLEERYERLDDGSQTGRATLKKIWQLMWGKEDGVSTVLPYDEGIHRVGNPGETTAISVHLYGPRVGEIDGRDYDPSREYVCDRASDGS